MPIKKTQTNIVNTKIMDLKVIIKVYFVIGRHSLRLNFTFHQQTQNNLNENSVNEKSQLQYCSWKTKFDKLELG